MDAKQAKELARELLAGVLSVDDFVGRLDSAAIADLGDVQLDLDRRHRCGFPEVIFAQGKSVETLEKIFHRLAAEGIDVLATRVSPEQARELAPRFPGGRYNPLGRTFRMPHAAPSHAGAEPTGGRVCIVTAGTGDLPVAEEARETALWMGVEVTLIQDVGVAGPQRLRAKLPQIGRADAVVVVAGMEGALPSVVGGHVACPVIAVPTSIGYGASLGGLAALLAMLNSCAANVAVVNIDAGFKAAYVAGMIARQTAHARPR